MSDVTISTHVLDTSLGAPAAGVAITLERFSTDGVVEHMARAVTNSDGRVPDLNPVGALVPGQYRLCFNVATYFAAARQESFYREICVSFIVGESPQHYHVPLLLSPFGYSTYRGS